MNVLVIEPGHGSEWITDAIYVDRFGKANPRGRYVQGSGWEYDGGWNMPDDYQGQPITLTFPRRWILMVEENGVVTRRAKLRGKNGYPRIEGR